MKHKNLRILVPIFALQALTIFALMVQLFGPLSAQTRTSLWILNLTGFANVVIVLIVVKKCFMSGRTDQTSTHAFSDATCVEGILLAARAQRHDFRNHLTVIHGLLSVGMPSEAKTYIDQFCAEVKDVDDLLSLGKPVIGSLLLNKISVAKAMGIDFKLAVRTDLASLPVKETDIIKVLGNIIDNAMEAVQTAPSKEIALTIDEKDNEYVFELTDSGTGLNENLVRHIFKSMFSTKGPDRGVGLFIAKQTAQICGGEIEVKLSPTTFTVRFAKQ